MYQGSDSVLAYEGLSGMSRSSDRSIRQVTQPDRRRLRYIAPFQSPEICNYLYPIEIRFEIYSNYKL